MPSIVNQLIRVGQLEDMVKERDARIVELETRLANLEGLRIGDEIAKAQAQARYEALRPLAVLGERALREGWYNSDMEAEWHCCTVNVSDWLKGIHAETCETPALLAQARQMGEMAEILATTASHDLSGQEAHCFSCGRNARTAVRLLDVV